MQNASDTRPSVKRHGSFAVYGSETGKVICWFHIDLLPGAPVPSQAEIEREALTSGSRASGLQESSLRLLSINAADVERGKAYAVDLETGTLRKIATPTRPE